jgi:predicted permease
MIALGKVLERRGVLNQDHRNFANWLTYNFALPALVFTGVAKQRFFELFEPPLLFGPFCAIVLVMLIFVLLARVLRLKGGLAAAFVFGTFWANVSYMGFPLARNAYGAEGMTNAAIYNAFIMPFSVILGFVMIGMYRADRAGGGFGRRIRGAFLNPIVVSALLGIVTALTAELFRDSRGGLQLPGIARSLIEIAGSFLELVGSMGLPLALLSIGGSMHLSETRKRGGLLVVVLVGKLLLFPLLTLAVIRLFFPGADPVAAGVAVTLAATPNAVASFVVARQIGVEEGFVSSMLVISTALSVFTLPFWLYFVL